MKKGTVYKRTFEAANFPVGSERRKKLNEKTLTSEYYTSKKYLAVVERSETKTHLSYTMEKCFRTQKEAVEYVEEKTK